MRVAGEERMMMRALLVASFLSAVALCSGTANAGPRPSDVVVSHNGKLQAARQYETYRGYLFDLSDVKGRHDFPAISEALHHQIDIVESVGLSQRVLQLFHSIPIIADEAACLESPLPALACYGSSAPQQSQRASRDLTVWDRGTLRWVNSNAIDLAEDTRRGVVMIRPGTRDPQRPVLLHEMLHAYHHNMMPLGFRNPAIALQYSLAKSKHLYPDNAYLMLNPQEFFAVTGSTFLYGKDTDEFTRLLIKEKQPDYYDYLAWLFEVGPEHVPGASPLASAR
jgi:hypothetical protein